MLDGFSSAGVRNPEKKILRKFTTFRKITTSGFIPSNRSHTSFQPKKVKKVKSEMGEMI